MAAAERVLALQARLAGALAAALRRFFTEQAARVVARFLAGDADPVPDREALLLVRVAEPHALAAVLAVSEVAAALVGEAALVEADPAVLAILAQSATRLRAVTETTRRAVRETLVAGAEAGYSPHQIAQGVPRDGFVGLRAVVRETYAGRAETVARTEVALAAQEAAHDRYHAAGVRRVRISDGDGCGWTSHSDPDRANGSTRWLWEAQRHPTAHPNCRRVSLPVIERNPA